MVLQLPTTAAGSEDSRLSSSPKPRPAGAHVCVCVCECVYPDGSPHARARTHNRRCPPWSQPPQAPTRQRAAQECHAALQRVHRSIAPVCHLLCGAQVLRGVWRSSGSGGGARGQAGGARVGAVRATLAAPSSSPCAALHLGAVHRVHAQVHGSCRPAGSSCRGGLPAACAAPGALPSPPVRSRDAWALQEPNHQPWGARGGQWCSRHRCAGRAKRRALHAVQRSPGGAEGEGGAQGKLASRLQAGAV